MRIRAVFALLGEIIILLGFAFVLPLIVALNDGTSLKPFLIPLLISVVLGLLLRMLDRNPEVGTKEAFLLVSLSWLAVAIMGALPYIISGKSSLANPVNALFESMSGFTTTGATVLNNFSEPSQAILFWRQLTQWLGGMGIVVLAIAILPRLSVGGAELMSLEAPGPQLQKLTPHIRPDGEDILGNLHRVDPSGNRDTDTTALHRTGSEDDGLHGTGPRVHNHEHGWILPPSGLSGGVFASDPMGYHSLYDTRGSKLCALLVPSEG